MPITNFDKYSKFTSDNPNLTADFKPLNFDELLNLGAFRVTHQGMDNGKYNPNPQAGFSLVSAYNDAVGENTRKWKDNPIAYNVVKNMFTKNPQDIGVHKYLQIVESAKDLGIPENKIYAQPNRKALIEQQINEISQD
jgi:hypothetical protein